MMKNNLNSKKSNKDEEIQEHGHNIHKTSSNPNNRAGKSSNDSCGHEECSHDHNHANVSSDDEGLYNTLQQKYMEYQMLEQQSKQLSDQLQKIAEQLYEIEFIRQSLEDYNKVNEGAEMLSPISSGIFVKAKTFETDSFYVNVGSNVVVKKNLEQAKELMKRQAEQLKSAHDRLVIGFEQVNGKLQMLESELMKLSGQ
jgi:prefoldin alpha subunit